MLTHNRQQEEKTMQHFEISLTNSADGWHWTLLNEMDDGRLHVIAESDYAFPTASIAAAEAEAQIFELNHAKKLKNR